jgi:hypothetical protein
VRDATTLLETETVRACPVMIQTTDHHLPNRRDDAVHFTFARNFERNDSSSSKQHAGKPTIGNSNLLNHRALVGFMDLFRRSCQPAFGIFVLTNHAK